MKVISLKNLIKFFFLFSFQFSYTESRFIKNINDDKTQFTHINLYILPDEGRKIYLEAFNSAEKTIDIMAYKFTDMQLTAALKKACKRGVKVRVLSESNTYIHSRTSSKKVSLESIEKFGAQLFYTPKTIKQIHGKLIIIDKKIAMISTGNFDQESFDGIKGKEPAARDFFITTSEPNVVKNLQDIFNKDINEKKIKSNIDYKPLIIGPCHQRQKFLDLINNSNKSIKIYQQSLQDKQIVNALIKACKRGIKVNILMQPFPFGNKYDPNIPNQKLISKAGGTIYLSQDLYIHAKVMIIDEGEKSAIMYLGSCNFYKPSIDNSREIGILILDKTSISYLNSIFDFDIKKTIQSKKVDKWK